MKTVFIEGADASIGRMFKARGFDVVRILDDADLLVFSGGADVSPMLYRSIRHHTTTSDPRRDEMCVDMFLRYDGPKVGICRGAQFLNVMCGGRLFQNVTGHALGGQTHPGIISETRQRIQVTSTHHQQMIAHKNAKVLMTGDVISTRSATEIPRFCQNSFDHMEALYYERQNCLCYQPHPEYVDAGHECQTTFFNFIQKYLRKS